MYVTNPNEFYEAAAHNKFAVSSFQGGDAEKKREIATGKCLFREGDDANSVFEVKTGVLRLTRVLENGRRQVIAFGLPGDIIGFSSLGYHMSECDAIASAEVVEHSVDPKKAGGVDPELRDRLYQAALREISAMQDHFMMLGRKSAREKIASFLMVLSDRLGEELGAYTHVKLPMTRSDIADFLGLTTETVSRTFSQLRAEKVIALEGNKALIVLNADQLLDYAECD
ncbi:helix-turn-helix domain-containing protein [Actibacterium lipolyticum]|uniref:Nitrogen fixation regulation protein FixK n=1 Tax=Actibacterium lipolyticum TaxID=1524263 RepID=A0A238KHY3_9RHOB|nr:helix-turn-helix domain-containing protein [Actibacterium lipolyticum]SMX42445.1 Nitrogen fixation regulation protein FixK [Actibacterium lipolyticum]